MDLLIPETGTLFWTVIVFLLLIFVLKKFAWKPILTTLEDRENKIRTAIYQAEQDKKEAEKLLAEQRKLLEKARNDSIKMIEESKSSAEKTQKEIIEHARSEADRMIKLAKQEINISKEAAIAEVKGYAVQISFIAAQKVIGDALSEKEHLHLIEKQIKKVTQTP